MFRFHILCCVLAWTVSYSLSQTLPSSFPFAYQGIPNFNGNYSDSAAWQNYFLVNTSLPNITFPLQRSFAGNLPVNRGPNNTLYFYSFEQSYGSLTDPNSNKPQVWIMWLNGGPGSSSLAGAFFENGPIRIGPDLGASLNNFSWNNAADMLWVDQPVGTGFATADANGYVANEDEMAVDMLAFLDALTRVFPSLATRPLHLIGESYAGKYIPYIMKAYFGLQNPPVRIAKFAIGDGTIAAPNVYRQTSVLTTLKTYPQIINYDPNVYTYFKTQFHLCKLDLNLTYPQEVPLPTLETALPTAEGAIDTFTNLRTSLVKGLSTKVKKHRSYSPFSNKERKNRLSVWKRDYTDLTSQVIDPWYRCDIWNEMIDWALNHTFPWAQGKGPDGSFNFVPDALDPEAPLNANVFLNDLRTKKALHAPLSKQWNIFFNPAYPFGNSFTTGGAPANFLSELMTNVSIHNMTAVFYSGNDDTQDAHRGTEIAIQNTTFGGIRGFTRPPSTPWLDDVGNLLGVVHQERGVTYVIVNRAGHQVPLYNPRAALALVQEFIIGNNPLGAVITSPSGNTVVVGGENSTFTSGVLPGEHNPIFYGSGTTQFSTFWPSATIAAWDSFIAKATATPTPL
ncbi:Alpha/Beta hydrolase protein [Hysterangium stoloniferum]|nr:Alpha/Beta hydrolase protein [Hysterangium stoloniferum]